jgi:peptide/nickel transport system substrate-binding protein
MMIQKRKVLTLVVCLMVVGLIASLISGCAPTGDGGDEDGNGDDTPQYGGELTVVVAADPVGYDDAIVYHYQTHGPYECLWSGDWAKGNAGGYGTGECGWLLHGELNRLEFDKGYLAESYEIGDDYIIFHLRDGVKWHDKYPCNGREATADDVLFSIERQRTLSTAYLCKNYPATAAAMSVYKIDENMVRIDCSSQEMPNLLSLIDFMYIYPHDVIKTYGDINDWERAIGTGAFSLNEYVEGSYIYYERNPDYWGTNPVGPGEGDQLPYLNGVKTLIEPDPSTIDSLFTNGQIAVVTADTSDYDRVEALKILPAVEYVRFFDHSNKGVVIYMRTDKADKPYHDVRVRQALMLAIDNQKIVDELYGGEGEILYWPVYYCKEYAGAYLPLEDLNDDMIEDILPGESISVADLFEYNLELAQELLAEAGYPDGFQAEIVVWNSCPHTDVITMVKDMWAEIGVDLTIKPLDFGAWNAMQYFRSYNDMLYGFYANVSVYFKGINWSGTTMWNTSYVDDPVLNDYRDQMLAAYPDEEECDRIHREMLPYLLEQCYVLQTAGHYTYRFWWPWVKNYSGEGSLGYYKGLNNGFGGLTQYVWIDQELKEEMGHGN